MKTTLRYLVLGSLLALLCAARVHAANVLQNPGFELVAGGFAAGWTNMQSAYQVNGLLEPQYVHSGTGAIQCNGWGEWGAARQTYENVMLGGQTVTASVWAMIPATAIISGGWNGAILSLYETDFPPVLATTNFITAGSPTGVWVQGTIIAELPADTHSIDVMVQAASVPNWSDFQGPVFFDDAVLEAQTTNVPSAPSSIAATHGAYGDKVRVTWSASANASTYAVYRAAQDSSAGATNLATTGAQAYDDLSVAVGQTNYYWVKAGNSNGWSGFSSSAFGYLGAPSVALLNPGFESYSGTPEGDFPKQWTRIQRAWWVGLPNVHSGTGAVVCNGWGEWGGVRQTFVSGDLAGNSVTASIWGMILGTAVISGGWNGAVLSLAETGGGTLATTNFITAGSARGTWLHADVVAEHLPLDLTSVDLVLQAASGPDWTYFQGQAFFDDAALTVVIPETGLGLGLLVGWALAWRRRY